jgi:MoxR-like ATPase
LAINVALATSRPLLVTGPPGSGKSSLPASVAAILGRRYYEQVITSRTQAHDILWQFDALRRLNDAELGRLHLADQAPTANLTDASSNSRFDVAKYVEPPDAVTLELLGNERVTVEITRDVERKNSWQTERSSGP